MHRGVEDKVILVTGAGRGLGEAICLLLGEAGARVVAADIDPRAAERIAGKVGDGGTAAQAMALDVGDERQAEEAVRAIATEHGRLDGLVNNAGTDVTVSIDELALADWDRILRTNLRGPFLLSKFSLRVMKAQGEGHIVNIVSTAAKRAWANAAAYHASKWGLLGFSHALHVEARPHGVKVTAVIAGGMRTPFLLDRFPEIDVNVLQDPRSVAETVLFALTQPAGTVIPEVMVLPMGETSWP
jgi:NAD(P)-dependent dehydrogenase (short-subunit alcohol dehydrogenase family)